MGLFLYGKNIISLIKVKNERKILYSIFYGGTAMDLSFYKGKKVLLTGHTGFKGTWMSRVLISVGADLTGYSLEAPTTPSLFQLCKMENDMKSVIGDVRNLKLLAKVFEDTQPEIVIHMAAQPLVRESYKNPVNTYEVNVLGTVNVLECIRMCSSVKSFINVTTDKVYLNKEWEWGYREIEELNGYDPYSNSKSCSELVTSCYRNSFFNVLNKSCNKVALSTVRAGNVIGGGDFAEDRIIPDCIRAIQNGKDIVIRNPYSTRPYQHVLEPVMAYLMIAEGQYKEYGCCGSYNVGPLENDCYTTGELVSTFCDKWNKRNRGTLNWINISDGGPHEANFLKLDCSKIEKVFQWRRKWDVKTALDKIIDFTEVYLDDGNLTECIDEQIYQYMNYK